jgi:hypothetical protein
MVVDPVAVLEGQPLPRRTRVRYLLRGDCRRVQSLSRFQNLPSIITPGPESSMACEISRPLDATGAGTPIVARASAIFAAAVALSLRHFSAPRRMPFDHQADPVVVRTALPSNRKHEGK